MMNFVKNITHVFFLIFIFACGSSQHDSMHQIHENPDSVFNSIDTSISPSLTLLPNLDDTTIFHALYGSDELMVVDINDGTDTSYLGITSRFEFSEGEEDYALIRLLAETGTQHGHFLFREDIAVFQKSDTGWVLSDTILDGFAFDVVDEPQMMQKGPYTLFEFRNEGAYSGGNYEKGVAYLVIRNGRILHHAGYSEFVESNNAASEFCILPEDHDPDFECLCEETKGDLKVSYDKEKDALLYTYLGRITSKCEKESTCFIKRVYMANTHKGELILETKNCAGKRDTLRFVPPEKRLK